MDIHSVGNQWKSWIKNKTHIRSKLSPIKQRKADHFLTTHASSEASLRRLLFIGLRMKKVTYKAANEWMYHHQITFGKLHGQGNFIVYFDRLFPNPWASVLQTEAGLDDLWLLWNDYAKPIRNHLAHALRKYDDEWLDAAFAVDRLFMMKIEKAINPVIGGTPFAHLKNLSPPLPRGSKDNDVDTVLGIRTRSPRPRIGLADARIRVENL